MRIIYWIATILLSLMMLFAVFNYIFHHEAILEVFVRLGFPTYLIYPLATAKTLGVIAVLTKRSATLKEWAYAGFFFNFLLAFSAHIHAGDDWPQAVPAGICMVLLAISYTFDRRLYKNVD